MKKAILLVAALAVCVPAPAATAACAETHGSSAHVHSGPCGPADNALPFGDLVNQIVDPVICLLDSAPVVDC